MKPLLVQFAAEAALEGDTLSGVAHAFGGLALTGDHYESFSPQAFNAAMKTSDTRAFIEHDRAKLLGRVSSGTLRVSIEQRDGKPVLAYSIDLPNTSYANDLRELVARGDLNESSFGVIPGEFKWSTAPDGKQVRTHTKVAELIDVSPVTLPAFTGTSVQLHSQGYEAESIGSQLVRARARVLFGGTR